MVRAHKNPGLRSLLLLAASCAPACSATDIGAPSVTGVEPSQRTEDMALRVDIVGEEFVPKLAIDPAGDASVDAGFEAHLIYPDGETTAPLDDVRFKSTTRLTGTIPSGLPPGSYGVRVVTPTGDVARRSGVFLNKLAPVIQTIDPVQATVVGGGKLIILGRHFVKGAEAGLGPGCPDGEPPKPLNGPERESTERLTGLVPRAEAPGSLDVWVTTEHGTGCMADAFRYVSVRVPPDPLSISPEIGPTEGGTQVVIEVLNLTEDATARVGGKTLTARAIDLAAGTITGFTQPNEPGLVNVAVEAPGVGANILQDRFRYVAQPAIGTISPAAGPQGGGSLVSIRGEGFVGDDVAVTFNGVPGTELQVSDERSLRVRTPPGRGEAHVEVTAIGGAGAKVAGYLYRQPPAITGITPTVGRAAGSVQVIISGERLDTDDLFVTIGGRVVAGQQSLGPEQIVGILPAGSGEASVAVAGADGVAYLLDAFSYKGRPEVRVVRPRTGRAGDEIEIRGRGFLADTMVTLGGAPVESLQVHSPSHMTGVVPDGQGLVDMFAEHEFGASDPVPDAFQYQADDSIPQLHSVHPASGPEAGGQRFWLVGASLPDQVTVRFGDATVTDAVSIDGQVIVGTTPAGNGDGRPADVIVQAGGVSPRLGAAYAYGAAGPLVVRSVRPAIAPETGQTPLTVRGGGFGPLTRILVGGRPLRESVVTHDGEIRGICPAGSGTVDVIAVDPEGQGRSTHLRDAVTYLPDGVAAIGVAHPDAGPVEGGVSVELHGLGLAAITRVQFGGEEAADVEVIDDTLVRATAPAHAPGNVSVALCVDAACPAELTLLAAFTYIAADDPLRISAVTPAVGHPAGGQRFTVYGGPFGEDVEILWSDGEPLEIERIGSGQLEAVAPAGAGDVDVIVKSGGRYARAVRGFRYIAQGPSLDSVDPVTGPARGAQVVLTLQGDGFVLGKTRVFVGEAELDGVEVDGTGEALTATLPPSAPGVYSVRVETPQGADARPDAFIVEAPVAAVPEILSIHPLEGPSDGAVPVVIRGIHLDRIATGDLGGAVLDRVRIIDPSTLIALSTPGEVGGAVSVNLAEGNDDAYTLPAVYSYRPLPEVQSVSPDTTARVGGELVTVRFARGLTAETVVTVDGLEFADPDPDVAAGTFRGLLPPGEPIRRDLQARNQWGVGVLRAGVEFIPPPIIDRLEPSTGLLGGGGGVTIHGSGFDAQTVALFGARQLLNLRLVDEDRMEGTLPPGFGVIDVRVENAFGRSVVREGFSYLAAPRIGAVTPFMGPVSGGTPTVITGAGLGAETGFSIGGRPIAPTGQGVPLVRDPEEAVGIVPAGAQAGWAPLTLTDHRGDDLENNGFLYLDDVVALTGEGMPPPVSVRGIASHRITGAIWAATDAGLYKLDVQTDALTASSETPYALPSERVTSVALEDGGAMVVGTEAGAALCTTGAQLVCRQLDHRDVLGDVEKLHLTTVQMLPDGSLLLAGPAGVFRMDPGGAEPPLTFEFGQGGAPGSTIRDSALAPDGRVWLATDAGLAVFDPAALAFTTHDLASTGGGLGDDDVRAVDVSVAGTVWAGTGSGLFRFDPAAGAAGWSAVADLDGELIHAIEIAASGDLWVGSEEGLLRVAGSPAVVVARRGSLQGLPADRVLSVHVGARGGVWVGTASGLARHAGP